MPSSPAPLDLALPPRSPPRANENTRQDQKPKADGSATPAKQHQRGLALTVHLVGPEAVRQIVDSATSLLPDLELFVIGRDQADAERRLCEVRERDVVRVHMKDNRTRLPR